MRIGIDARMLGFAPAGIGRYIDHLTQRLFSIDHENEYILFLREPMFSRYRLAHSRIHTIFAPERWYSLAEQIVLPFRFARAKLDVLFVPQFNVPLAVPCPFVVTIHDVTQLYMPGPLQARSSIRQQAFRLIFRHAVKRARAVIAVSQYTKNEIIKNFAGDGRKIHVIYEGPGLAPEMRETGNSNTESRNKTQTVILSEQKGSGFRASDLDTFHGGYILAVGIWRPHKNFAGLVDAFALLRQRPEFSTLKLVLVGEEDSRYPEVRRRIEALALSSHIIVAGRVSDAALVEWYRHARAVVVPSFYEGLGFVGLEALHYGLPVVASKTAALPEILGDAARYFDPHDHNEMASVIATVLNNENERRYMLAQAPRVLARYSWDRAAQETLSLFQHILNEEKIHYR